jgi:hypothetical protein
MQGVMLTLSAGQTAHVPPVQQPGAYTADLACAAPKLYVDRLEGYDGIPIKWEGWEVWSTRDIGTNSVQQPLDCTTTTR